MSLFNGRDLTGFYTFLRDRGRDQDPKGVFTVNDGLLRISGEEGGCITTTEEYENYRLVAEFLDTLREMANEQGFDVKPGFSDQKRM